MERLFIRLISFLIFDKEKRDKFRQKYDIVAKFRKELNDRSHDLRVYFKQYLHQYLNEQFHDIFIQKSARTVMSVAIEQGFVKDEEDHYKNVEKLKYNLDDEATKNLDNILNRLDKLNYARKVLLSEFYSDEEFQAWVDSRNFKYKIEKIEDYYQYKHYKLPINYFEPSVFTYKHGMDKLKTLNNLGDKVIIDAGAFVLDSALVFRDYTKNKIIAFEPTEKTYELGLKTMKLNNLHNVVYEKLALGDKNEESLIFINENCPSGNGLDKSTLPGHEPQKVQCITLDSYVKENNLEIGFIKVDLEGFEQYFIKGALNTIKEQKPILIMSIYHNYDDFYKIKPFLESLNLGYKFNFFKGVDYRHTSEIMLLAEVY